ncbi:MAG TPA: hypothetical protein VGK99_20975 [Acidobacteriota bacterium]|jgi:hypothetical protein
MRKIFSIWIFCLLLGSPAAGQSNTTLLRELLLGPGFPAKIKSKNKVARWDQIDQLLNLQLAPKTEGLPDKMKAKAPAGSLGDMFSEKYEVRKLLSSNGILFSDLFDIGENDFFPLTNSVLKFVPEGSLEGETVYDKSGQVLGKFAGKSRYERTGGLYGSGGFRLITFQYKTPQGEFRSAGHDNLLDNYVVFWSRIKQRPALDLSFLIN